MVKTKELEFIPPKKRKEPKSKEAGKNNTPHNSVNVDHISKFETKLQVKNGDIAKRPSC